MRKDKSSKSKGKHSTAEDFLKAGMSDKKVYNKLEHKYDDDQRKIDKIFKEFIKKKKVIIKAAQAFKDKFLAKAMQYGPSTYKEFERKARSAYEKTAKKHDLPHLGYTLFLDSVILEKGKEQGVKFADSKMAKLLGFTDILKSGKLNYGIDDEKNIAQIKTLGAQTRTLHEKLILDSITYDINRFISVNAETGYINTAYVNANNNTNVNFYNHVHPVVFALCVINNEKIKTLFFESNIATIVNELDNGTHISTVADFEVYKNIVMDISGVQSSKNPSTDLLNRFELQVAFWNEALCVRTGRIYECRLDKFLAAIDKYRDNIYEAPTKSFNRDNATILRRLFNSVSYRPVRIRIGSDNVLNGLTGQTAVGRFGPTQMGAFGNTYTPGLGVSNVTNIPLINIKVNSNGNTNIKSSLKGWEWFLNNGMMYKVNQEVLKCQDVKDIIVISTDRIENQIVTNEGPFSFGKLSALQLASGWDSISLSALTEHQELGTTAVNNHLKIVDNGDKYPKLIAVVYYHYHIQDSKYYVIGSAMAYKHTAINYLVYNPLSPISVPSNTLNNLNYISPYTNMPTVKKQYMYVTAYNVATNGITESLDGIHPVDDRNRIKNKIETASSLLFYTYQA